MNDELPFGLGEQDNYKWKGKLALMYKVVEVFWQQMIVPDEGNYEPDGDIFFIKHSWQKQKS